MRRISTACVAEELTHRAPSYLPLLGMNTPVTWHIRRHSHPSRWIFLPFRVPPNVFEVMIVTAQTPSVRTRLYVKIHETPSDAVREFRNLQFLWDRFASSSEFRISEPIDIVDRLNAVVTAGVGGFRISDLIRLSRILPLSEERIRELVRCVEQAGRWLRFLQSIGTRGSEFLESYEGTSVQLDDLIKEARIWGFPSDLLPRVRSRFNRIRQELRESRSVLITDFTPEHVFLDRHEVSVIDFYPLRLGSRAYDLASFLSYLDLMLMRLNVGRFSDFLRYKFTSAVIGHQDPDINDLMDGYSVMFMLKKWVEIKGRLRSEHSPNLYALLPFIAKRALKNIRQLCDSC